MSSIYFAKLQNPFQRRKLEKNSRSSGSGVREFKNKSACVPVLVKSKISFLSFCFHTSSQSGRKWHYNCLLVCVACILMAKFRFGRATTLLLLTKTYCSRVFYILRQNPEFSVNATLLLRSDNNSSSGLLGSSQLGMLESFGVLGGNKLAEEELYIINSMTTMQQVIQTLGIQTEYYKKDGKCTKRNHSYDRSYRFR